MSPPSTPTCTYRADTSSRTNACPAAPTRDFSSTFSTQTGRPTTSTPTWTSSRPRTRRSSSQRHGPPIRRTSSASCTGTARHPAADSTRTTQKDFLIADGLVDIRVSRLNTYALKINGRRHHLDWAATLRWLRAHFATAEPVWAALTQGDPTDVNLAHPLAWFDYDTAGMNSIPGEFANFLWYASALGGWLVPTYNPTAFADHPATFTHVPANTPEIRRAAIDHATSTIDIDYTPRLSAPRRAAVTAYWNKLVRPVADRLWPGEDLANLLRPYLAMRILGVYNLADLTAEDRLVLLARLAEAMSPAFDPATYFCPLESPCPAS